MKDKQGNKLNYTPAHIARFNQLSPNEYAFEHSEPSKIWSGFAPTKSVVKLPATTLAELYKTFVAEGGSGTFEQFRNSPQTVDLVYSATGAKK
jgi:hypothetical protein